MCFLSKVHGYLQEASKLTCEYISAVLGNGQEYFGLTTSLHGSAPPVWLPHNLIDQLLLELREKSQDSAYHKVTYSSYVIGPSCFEMIVPFKHRSIFLIVKLLFIASFLTYKWSRLANNSSKTSNHLNNRQFCQSNCV
jgi:hypothetical protein